MYAVDKFFLTTLREGKNNASIKPAQEPTDGKVGKTMLISDLKLSLRCLLSPLFHSHLLTSSPLPAKRVSGQGRHPAVHSPFVETPLQYFSHKFLEEIRALILWPTSLALQTPAHNEAKIKDYFSFNFHDLLEQCCPEKCLRRVFYMYKKSCLAGRNAIVLGE